jgi:hypothetical protein
MRKISILIFLSFLGLTKSKSQDVLLETFDSKKSIKSWLIITELEPIHNNQFNFQGVTYSKKTKDSFLIFLDTKNIKDYQITLIKKFKMTPSRNISLHHSIYSEDSLNDYLDYGFRLNDKTGKNIFGVSYFSQHDYNPGVVISGPGYDLPEANDTIWKKVDSLEVYYSFIPYNIDSTIERIIVLDGITLNEKYASVKNYSKPEFLIYPNPANDILNFKFSSSSNPKQIYVYDYTGRLLIKSKAMDELNIAHLNAGFYYVTIQFENGMATKKIEVF